VRFGGRDGRRVTRLFFLCTLRRSIHFADIAMHRVTFSRRVRQRHAQIAQAAPVLPVRSAGSVGGGGGEAAAPCTGRAKGQL